MTPKTNMSRKTFTHYLAKSLEDLFERVMLALYRLLGAGIILTGTFLLTKNTFAAFVLVFLGAGLVMTESTTLKEKNRRSP